MGYLRLAALLVSATAPLFAGSASGFDLERIARAHARMDAFVDQGTIAGMVTLVSRNGGDPIVHTAGFLDLEARKPMPANAIFALMSMTKPVTALGILILAEEGKLLLTDPVEKHLPQFKGIKMRDAAGTLKDPPRPITIRDLLTHTSGMNRVPPERLHEVYFKMNHTLAEVVDVYAHEPLDFAPGTQWQYSNCGMATLGRIIEVLSGQKYEDFLSARVFKPLGMKDTFFFPPPDKTDRIAIAYRPAGGKLQPGGSMTPGGESRWYRKGATYSCPECGLYSTAADLAVLYQMFLNGGTHRGVKIISRPAVDLMTTNQTPTLPKSFGLGWEVTTNVSQRLHFSAPGSFGHGGALGTQAWIDPSHKMFGIFLIQRTGGGGPGEFNTFESMVNTAVGE